MASECSDRFAEAKLAREIVMPELGSPVSFPGRPSETLNQRLESDLDAPKIDLNVNEHDSRRKLLTLAVKLDDKPVNTSLDSGAQCYPTLPRSHP
jgi:hypothetical protein